MAVCTFFGHRDCPDDIRESLKNTLENLIENREADTFYVGNQGAFDRIVLSVLRELVKKYLFIRYFVVFAYLPNQKLPDGHAETILPDGIETVPPRFAIARRNRWMLRQADIAVVFVRHHVGCAAQYAEEAERKGKTVIYL